jgi:hypothetical protein
MAVVAVVVQLIGLTHLPVEECLELAVKVAVAAEA